MASKNETVGSTDAQVRMGEVSVYFLLLIYHRANLRAVTTECENQSTDVRRYIVFGLPLPRARRGQLGSSIPDAGIASCVSGPRLAHVFLWYWFDGPGVFPSSLWLQGAEAVIESPEITQGLLLLHGFRVLLNHVDAVTFGGADNTG
ncbi:hypothetical protein D6D24_06132 [Aureobasidium pullulans]|uniref:Uncharacterized protein n=1 Tax=Aureobasidium pullulans TaxID=5580 RepID=A0A4S8VS69_AURPU|nr:hypothetical protein D6D24_06132 [Aureobasidium pullulans]